MSSIRIEMMKANSFRNNDSQRERIYYQRRLLIDPNLRDISILTKCRPFWLSPRQVLVVPISPPINEYAKEVAKRIKAEEFYVDADTSTKQFKKKIFEGQTAQYNFILVCGGEEAKDGTVSVRVRGGEQMGKMTIDSVIDHFKSLVKNFK